MIVQTLIKSVVLNLCLSAELCKIKTSTVIVFINKFKFSRTGVGGLKLIKQDTNKKRKFLQKLCQIVLLWQMDRNSSRPVFHKSFLFFPILLFYPLFPVTSFKMIFLSLKTFEIGLLNVYRFEVVVVKGVPNPTRSELLETIRGCSGVLWYGHIKVDQEMVDAAGKRI